MSNYVFVNGNLCHSDELMHFGVKGMKWGHRKARYQEYTNMREKKAVYKQANKSYERAINNANKYDIKHPISQRFGKNKKQSISNWKDVENKANAANRAERSYKQAKKEYKTAYKQSKQDFRDARKGVAKSRSLGHKLATNVLAGPFANRTYNSIRAAGGSRAVAIGATYGTALLGGPIGHLAVSAVMTRTVELK